MTCVHVGFVFATMSMLCVRQTQILILVKVRRLIYGAYTLVAHRCFPWRFAVLGDNRASDVERRSIISRFTERPSCCHRPGFARKLRDRFAFTRDLATFLDSKLFTIVIFQFARLVRLSIAIVERRHAWNRNHATLSTGFHNFTALYVNQEARRCLAARRRLMQLMEKARAPRILDSQAPALRGRKARRRGFPIRRFVRPTLSDSTLMKAQSAYQMFKRDEIRNARACGERIDVFNKITLMAMRTKWKEHPADLKMRYQRDSDLSRTISQRNRIRDTRARLREADHPTTISQPSSSAAPLAIADTSTTLVPTAAIGGHSLILEI